MNCASNSHQYFYTVLLHKIGYARGLHHYFHYTSTMFHYSILAGKITDMYQVDLSPDTIYSINQLYNPLTTSTTTTTTTRLTTLQNLITTSSLPPHPPLPPDLCTLRRKINTIFVTNKYVYLFYEKCVWIIHLDKTKIERHIVPKLITDWLHDLQ